MLTQLPYAVVNPCQCIVAAELVLLGGPSGIKCGGAMVRDVAVYCLAIFSVLLAFIIGQVMGLSGRQPPVALPGWAAAAAEAGCTAVEAAGVILVLLLLLCH